MKKTLNRTIVMAAAGLLVMAVSSGASAFPSRGGSCTDCHSTPGGSLTSSPDPLNINVGSNGLMTFTVTSLGGSESTAISVQGLENPLLAASIGTGGDAWTHRVNATYGMSYVSNDITSTGPYTLDLVIGSSATPGTYPIVVMYAGDGERGTAYNPGFNLTISPAGVAGDYNGNGVVDAADYVQWRNDPASFGGDPAGYDTWRANFGKTAGSGSVTSSAIPEPATLATLLVGTVAIMLVLARTSSPRCCRRS